MSGPPRCLSCGQREPVSGGFCEECLAVGSLDRSPSVHEPTVTADGAAEPRGRLDAPVSELGRGTALGRYLVLGPVGGGGAGVVYSAYDPELDRRVAVKVLRPTAAGGHAQDVAQSRLLREAQAMARLSHPNVLPVYDVGTFRGDVFLAMELVEGSNVRAWLLEAERGWREVLDVFLPAGRGLAAAHAAGLVHRDFKPANVLLGKDGRPRVTDFGLVRAASGVDEVPTRDGELPERPGALAARLDPSLDGALTHGGAVLGTPGYMAPEQYRAGPTDARTDQFSFCASLHEALYRQLPFEGATLPELARNVLHGVRRPPPKSARVPAWIARAVERGLSTDPKDRYPSMEALLADLGRDPSQRARRLVLTGVAAAVMASAAAAAFVLAPSRAALCRGAERKLAGIWDDPTKERVERAFLATGQSFAGDAAAAVRQRLDVLSAQWVAMHEESCEDTRVRGEQTEATLGLRMACLERRRKELRALVSLFEQADKEVVQQAVSAAESLPSLEGCADVSALGALMAPPADPATRAKVEQLQGELAEARALFAAGKFAQSMRDPTQLAQKAREIGYAPLEAEVQELIGETTLLLGNVAGAEEALEGAVRAAELGRDDAEKVRAYTELARLAGTYKEDLPGRHRWLRFGRAALDRLGGNEELDGQLHLAEATLLLREGKAREAQLEAERALALIEKVSGRETTDAARGHYFVGRTLGAQGELEKAGQQFARALELFERVLGRDHPDIATTLVQVGALAVERGLPAEALRHYERALAIDEASVGPENLRACLTRADMAAAVLELGRPAEALELIRRSLGPLERTLGKSHRRLIDVLITEGSALATEGKYAAALAPLRRALAIAQQRLGPEGDTVGVVLFHLGRVYQRQGHLQDALTAYRQARAIREKALGTEHPRLAAILVAEGSALLARHAARDAITPLERAVRMRERAQMAKPLVAEVRFVLARALWEASADKERAAALAQQALEGFGEGTPGKQEAGGWIAAHPARSRALPSLGAP